MNKELLIKTREAILKHRKQFNLNFWLDGEERNLDHCGTVGCIAGFVVCIAAEKPDKVTSIPIEAGELLGISSFSLRERLFNSSTIGNNWYLKDKDINRKHHVTEAVARIDHLLEHGNLDDYNTPEEYAIGAE